MACHDQFLSQRIPIKPSVGHLHLFISLEAFLPETSTVSPTNTAVSQTKQKMLKTEYQSAKGKYAQGQVKREK